MVSGHEDRNQFRNHRHANGFGLASMVSGHEDRNQHPRHHMMRPVMLASMVSGHEDRNQVTRACWRGAMVFWPQWCPAMKTGIRGQDWWLFPGANLPQWCPAMKTGIRAPGDDLRRFPGPTSMVSGHEDRNQRPDGKGRLSDQPAASMVSGHEDRNQDAWGHTGTGHTLAPQWCPAMKTGIRPLSISAYPTSKPSLNGVRP